ncbi:hypothetical protein ACSBR1_020432 [Camellia fascicularis]
MGGKLTAFENRAGLQMEIRALISPRPDQYVSITKIRPGSKFMMLHQSDVINYAKITCDIDENGLLNARFIKVRLPGLRKLRGFSFCLGSV